MASDHTIHDSGARRTATTGAQRDADASKPRIDLISPHAQWREGEWMRQGAEKYDDRNWESGMPFSWCVAALFRHLVQYARGDRDEDHLAAIRCNAAFLIHYEEEVRGGRLPATLDDLPRYADCAQRVAEREEAEDAK